MSTEELIEKIIKEQDLISLYLISPYNMSLGVLEEYSKEPKLYYSDIGNFILNHPEIIEEFSIKNLYILLCHIPIENNDIREYANELIYKKLDNETFFCEDIDYSFFLESEHIYNGYGNINEKTRKKLESQLSEELKQLQDSEFEKIDKALRSYLDAANFLKYYKDGIFNEEKREILEKMIDKNPHSLEYVNFGIFQDEIFEIGKYFCEYLSKFPSISYQLVMIKENNPLLLNVIKSKFKECENLQDNLYEIELLITYSARNVFEITDQEIDVNDYTECAYRNCNDFELINVKFGKDYNERLSKKLQEEYNLASNIEEKLNIYLNKVFSLNLENARRLLEEFASDLENLKGISIESREFFKELELAVQLKDESEIDNLFKIENIRYLPSKINQIKDEVSKECAKDFARELKKTDDFLKENITQVQYNGQTVKQVKLSGKFNVLMHSTDTNFINKREEVTDYKKSWQYGKDKEKHIVSTTYSNQDFIGAAPVGRNGVRYAFLSLDPKDIRLMGVSDLNTYVNRFAYCAKEKKYMSAKTLPRNLRRVYSEFGIERENVNPDYVVIFDDDLQEVKENSYEAAIQFNIPIIYMDKLEIEQEQIANLKNLIINWENTKDIDVLEELINTYETNVAGWLLNRSESEDDSHTAEINNSRFENDFKIIQSKIETLINEYFIEGKNIPDVVRILLHEIELYKKSEEKIPISKTRITLNVERILENANIRLDESGKSELKVDIEHLPTSKEYEVRIQEFVRNALNSDDPINIEDVYKAENFLNERQNETEKGKEF